MFTPHPIFTTSELFAIEQAVEDAKKEWLDIPKYLPEDSVKEITEEFDSILGKLMIWRGHHHGYYMAMKQIEESCRLQKNEKEAQNGN